MHVSDSSNNESEDDSQNKTTVQNEVDHTNDALLIENSFNFLVQTSFSFNSTQYHFLLFVYIHLYRINQQYNYIDVFDLILDEVNSVIVEIF